MKTTLVDVTRGVKIFLGGILIGLGMVIGVSILAHFLGVWLLNDPTLGIYVYTGAGQGGVSFWDLAGFEWDGVPGFFTCSGQC